LNDQEKFQYWLEHAQYDLETAEAMLKNGRWLYVVFMCQQAVEKLVKGLYGLYLDFDEMPRIHNIRTLIKRFEPRLPSSISPEYLHLFDTLTGYYINNRYPDYTEELAKKIKEGDSRRIHQETREAFEWLLTLKP
jgi:HEPN domain-containing protein